MILCFSQRFIKASLSFVTLTLAFPTQGIIADEGAVPAPASNQAIFYYPDNQECGFPCCQNSCDNKGCCYSKVTAIAGAAVLGGVAAAIVSRNSSHRHSSGNGGNNRRGNNNNGVVIVRDVGQTLIVSADIIIEELIGTATFTLFAKGEDNIPIQGSTETRTAAGEFVLTLPTIQDPIVGTYNIWVDITLSTGTDAFLDVDAIPFTITASRVGAPDEISTPDDFALSANSDIFNTQQGIEFNYRGP